MFHVELRQFPHVTRAFNWTAEQLEARIVDPWLAGAPVEWEDRRWAPDRARLTIYEAPELRPDQIGLGRGWANVTKAGVDVTAELLARRAASERSALGELRDELLRRGAEGPLTLDQVAALADQASAEQVVLELLREGRLKLVR